MYLKSEAMPQPMTKIFTIACIRQVLAHDSVDIFPCGAGLYFPHAMKLCTKDCVIDGTMLFIGMSDNDGARDVGMIPLVNSTKIHCNKFSVNNQLFCCNTVRETATLP